MVIARLMVLVMLLFVVVSSTGCGSAPKNIPSNPKIPLSKMDADGRPIPAGETPGSADKVATPNAATEEGE